MFTASVKCISVSQTLTYFCNHVINSTFPKKYVAASMEDSEKSSCYNIFLETRLENSKEILNKIFSSIHLQTYISISNHDVLQ
jgi:hypothetical protein